MWMNTESVIQSEVRREKQVSCISVSTYRESRKVVQTNPFAGREWRHRHREQTRGHSGGMGKVG